MKNKIFTNRLIPACGLAVAVSALAIVPPNTLSLLPTKNILIIDGTETTGDHYNARLALTAKFTQLRTLVGFTSTTVSAGSAPTSLDAYDIIVFNYWFNNHLSSAAFQNAFRAWVNSTNRRRGWLGMHTSGANEVNEWNWFRDSVTAMLYRVHSGGAQAGTIRRTTDNTIRNQPIMAGLPDTVRIPTDEWYDFAYPPIWADARVMYNLDEATLPSPLPAGAQMNPHPSTWYRENLRGNRFFYTALVHNASGVNLTAHNDFFTSMMLRALEYLAGYQTTPIVNGSALKPKGVICMCLANRDLQVNAQGAYDLKVWSPQGRLLYSVKHSTAAIHSVPAFAKPGMYLAKIESQDGVFEQRVMVY